jgi:hypothetical protein
LVAFSVAAMQDPATEKLVQVCPAAVKSAKARFINP